MHWSLHKYDIDKNLIIVIDNENVMSTNIQYFQNKNSNSIRRRRLDELETDKLIENERISHHDEVSSLYRSTSDHIIDNRTT